MFEFPKKQKLCSEKSIENLFAKGSYISEQSFRIVWKFEKNNHQVAVKSLIIVPKKNIKLAKNDVFVMHPGPMNRGVEIDSLLADNNEISLIRNQVEMGVSVRMACLEMLKLSRLKLNK